MNSKDTWEQIHLYNPKTCFSLYFQTDALENITSVLSIFLTANFANSCVFIFGGLWNVHLKLKIAHLLEKKWWLLSKEKKMEPGIFCLRSMTLDRNLYQYQTSVSKLHLPFRRDIFSLKLITKMWNKSKDKTNQAVKTNIKNQIMLSK